MTISENINFILHTKKMSKADLAAKLGLSYSTVQSWIKRNSDPGSNNIVAIAQALDVSIEYLLTGENSPPAEPEHPEDEKKLLQYYRESNPDGKDIILKTAYAISGTHPVNLLISKDGSS